MQLIIISFALVFLLLTQKIKAQVQQVMGYGNLSPNGKDSTQTEAASYEDRNWRNIDIDFLSSYYEQDGNNAAVTGGTGTEHLTDFTQKLKVKIPLTKKTTLNVDGGYDYYTSASSDKIDPIRSDDSREDVRSHANIGITRKLDPQQQIGFRLGGSMEYDYGSFQVGGSYQRLSKDENTSLNVQFQAFVDQWSLIYPIELRGSASAHTSNRQSFNLAVGVAQVLDKKTQASIQFEGIAMNGLLSTPFHRVYFQEQTAPRIESLPTTRFKVPIGIRLNRYVNEYLVARLYYRYYWDSWGMTAHTASVELPVKLTRFLSVAPFYRYHSQTGVDYFRPYKEASVANTFYTSDHDLAPLSSHSIGLGVNYQPVKGIFDLKLPTKKDKYIQLKSADLKYSHYLRSTGLQANIVSFGLGFTIH